MTHFEIKDDDTWQAYANRVKPLKGRERILPPEPKKIKLRDIKISEKQAPTSKPVERQPLPVKQVKKIKRQDGIIDATIDLHGMTLVRAKIALINFINKARLREWRYLEVITGKGNAEKGTGKIRREVPFWLQDITISPLILHVEEKMKTGGGSFLIVLRNEKKRG